MSCGNCHDIDEGKLGMKGSILYTKLQRPPVAPDIVPRDRLLAYVKYI